MKKKSKLKVGDIVVIRHFHPKASHYPNTGVRFNKDRYVVKEVGPSLYKEIPKFYLSASLDPLPDAAIQCLIVSNAVCIVRAKDTQNDCQT